MHRPKLWKIVFPQNNQLIFRDINNITYSKINDIDTIKK